MPLGLTPGLLVAVAFMSALVTAGVMGQRASARSLSRDASLALVLGGAVGVLFGILWLAWRILVLH